MAKAKAKPMKSGGPKAAPLKKAPPIRQAIAGRIREVRTELFGDHGGPELARRLGVPARSWYGFETGVSIPAEVLLNFLEGTGVEPGWLLTGIGSKYRRPD